MERRRKAGVVECVYSPEDIFLLNFEWGRQAAGLWADSSVLVVYGMRLVCDIGSIEFHSLQQLLYFSVPQTVWLCHVCIDHDVIIGHTHFLQGTTFLFFKLYVLPVTSCSA